MKILVTGGAGFIASHIADAFIKKGHKVIVVDNLSSGRKEFVNPEATFYQADITNRQEIDKIISKEKPVVITHHAAQISVRNSVDDPVNDANVNIIGLLNLLETGRMNNLKKIIFASSGGVVYGDAKVIPTSETYTPLQPISPYGVTKLASENYLYFYYRSYGIHFIALRYSNVYGPRQNPYGEAGVVAIFANKLLSGQTPVINGDGLQTRDYIYVSDVVKSNLVALETKETGAFNIGTGKETNVVELYDQIKTIIGSNIKANFGPAKQGEQKVSCLDVKKAKQKLNWYSRTDLEDGLKKTISYFRKND